MARPTQSTGLYVQCVGRGVRTYPGKDDCVVIDLADIQHDICQVGVLAGLSREDLQDGQRLSAAKQSAPMSASTPSTFELKEGVGVVATPLDVLGRSMFVWKTLGQDKLLLQASPTKRILVASEGEEHYRVVLRDTGGEEQVLGERLPLGYAQGVAEDYVRQENLAGFAGKDAAWRGQPASPKQKAIIRGYGKAVPEDLTKEQASEIISKCLAEERLKDEAAPWRSEPATDKQVSWLKSHGFRVNDGITRGEAADRMDRFFQRRRKKSEV